MSKLLYIHKPSLTAVVQYNPHPDVEKVAIVDMVAVADHVIMPLHPLGQPQAVLAVHIKRWLRCTNQTSTYQNPEHLVRAYIDSHPQLTREGN